MNKKLLLLIILALIGAVFFFDLQQYLSLEQFSSNREALENWRDNNPVLASVLYFAVYVAVTALSLPGAAVMTLVGGALFGVLWGSLLVSFASTLGALLAFLIARALLRDWVQQRFGRQLKTLNEGIERDGAFYLFSLRLVPLVPFFALNLMMALTPIRALPFYWVSQLGMLPATVIYVNAGTQLAQVQSGGDILSPALLGSLLLLAVLPWLLKWVLAVLERRRAFSSFSKPKSFDNNLLVIGAGSAGLVSALIAATVKAKVTLIERDKMGGDCLNTGCVPSKALIRSSRIAHYFQRAQEYGLQVDGGRVDFREVMARVHRTIAAIEPHDSVERYTGLGVNCVQGDAKLVSPWEVEVNGERISARNIILASGGRPRVPDIPGLKELDYLTSENLWEINELPPRLLVLGGGPIGCELAQAFHRLGSQVTMLVRSQLLPKEDEDVAAAVLQQFESDGITVLSNTRIQSFDGKAVLFDDASGSQRLEFDRVLVATGREARTEGMGLEPLGITTTEAGTLAVDKHLRTGCPTVYACGDVVGPYQFTHVASHQAWYAAVNSLFGSVKKFAVDYSVIPWVTFSDPEVARVGLNEREAVEQGIDYEITRYGIDDLDRAIADGEAHGFVKILTQPGKDRILGVTIVGYHASELIAEYILAMRHGLGLNKVLGTIHIYPTLSEANKFAAGEWKKARKPEGLLNWVERFHNWRR